MVNSRQKGSAGERELARVLRETLGVEARRGQQYCGSPDSPDVVTSLDGLHIECKRVEALSLYKALKQAIRDAGEDEIPCVMHRRSREDWVVIVRLRDARRFAEIISSTGKNVSPRSSEGVSSQERGNGQSLKTPES